MGKYHDPLWQSLLTNQMAFGLVQATALPILLRMRPVQAGFLRKTICSPDLVICSCGTGPFLSYLGRLGLSKSISTQQATAFVGP